MYIYIHILYYSTIIFHKNCIQQYKSIYLKYKKFCNNISYCDKMIIIYCVTSLYRYSIVEDDEANVAYSHSIDEDPTALHPLLVVGLTQNVA